MFMPTRETHNITVVDDADIPWPIRPIDFPAPDDEIVPYLNEAWQGEVYDQTLTEITLPLKFSYTFVGTQRVALYGVALPRLNGTVATAKYTLDNRPPVVLQPANVLDTLTNAVFFSADDLAAGTHTLTVEVDAGPSYPYVVDYLQYESFDASTPVSSLSTTFTSTTFTVVPSPSSSQSTVVASSSTPSPAAASSSNTVGAIVGGVIGGLALLCIMVIALVWHLHRRPSQDSTRKASIFSADSMVQPPSRPVPAPINVPVKLYPYKMTKTVPTGRASTVVSTDSDMKSASCPSSAATTPVSERPPTIRLEPPPRIASSSYLGGRYIPSSYDVYELFGSPPAYSLR